MPSHIGVRATVKQHWKELLSSTYVVATVVLLLVPTKRKQKLRTNAHTHTQANPHCFASKCRLTLTLRSKLAY